MVRLRPDRQQEGFFLYLLCCHRSRIGYLGGMEKTVTRDKARELHAKLCEQASGFLGTDDEDSSALGAWLLFIAATTLVGTLKHHWGTLEELNDGEIELCKANLREGAK